MITNVPLVVLLGSFDLLIFPKSHLKIRVAVAEVIRRNLVYTYIYLPRREDWCMELYHSVIEQCDEDLRHPDFLPTWVGYPFGIVDSHERDLCICDACLWNFWDKSNITVVEVEVVGIENNVIMWALIDFAVMYRPLQSRILPVL